jgi:LTXXQ motif family protein
MKSPARIAVLAAIAGACATAAIAQTAGTAGTGPVTKGFEQHDPVARMKSMCIDHFARSAGRLAYLEARLQLTGDQQPLWDKWRQSVAAGAEKERNDCLADLPAAGQRPTALDRDSHMEKMLATKVATLEAARPALEALYNSLTPEQRVAFDRPMHGHHDGHFGHHKPEAAPL